MDSILKLGNTEVNLQEPTIRGKRYMKYVQIAMTRLWKPWNLCILVKIRILGGIGMEDYTDINKQFHTNPLVLDFVNKISSDASGDNVYQSPLWIRPDSLGNSALSGYHHVVGHTRIKEISIIEVVNRKLIFTDTQLRQYLIINTCTESEEIIES